MLSHNHFMGTLPSHFKTTQLGVLLLDSNKLTGTIPTEFCALTALANVDISRNRITGTIPTQIGLLKSLHTIDAMHNRISGSLPNEMLQLNRNLRLNFTDNLYVPYQGGKWAALTMIRIFLTRNSTLFFQNHGNNSIDILWRGRYDAQHTVPSIQVRRGPVSTRHL